jgi:choline kinase
MNYKVCILAAGKNSRVSYAVDYNISLLPVGTKSALTRIIDKFPKQVEIIIAAGYNSDLIKDFVKIAYSDKNITIVDVENYAGAGSGPGKSLLSCKSKLDCPFIFTSADTLVSEDIPEPSKNWIGVSQISDSTNYCVAEVENEKVVKFYDKIDTPTLLKTCKNYKTILNNGFVGMAGVYDFKIFWEGLESNSDLINKELQVSNGLSALIEEGITPIHFFNWFDIGNEAGYSFANRFFEKSWLIAKPDEFIYFENGKVIKYFANKERLKDRITRASKLKNIVPEITDVNDNFYAYAYVEGKTLVKTNDVVLFKKFLEFCNQTVWRRIALTPAEYVHFKKMCDEFYHTKTNQRLEKFYKENTIKDQVDIINGETVPTVADMLKQIDWKQLSEGIPVLFHGDLQPENIIVSDKGFQLIDWRENFMGSTEYGDIYYDFAKLYHALIVTHEIIRNNQFEIKVKKNYVNYDYLLKNNLLEYKSLFEEFLQNNGFELSKVKTLTALIFLNIAPLHHHPYNHFLYYLGKYNLFKELNMSKSIEEAHQ